jgi:hypothetical protein
MWPISFLALAPDRLVRGAKRMPKASGSMSGIAISVADGLPTRAFQHTPTRAGQAALIERAVQLAPRTRRRCRPDDEDQKRDEAVKDVAPPLPAGDGGRSSGN